MESEAKDEFVIVVVRNVDEIVEKVGKLCNELGKERKKRKSLRRKRKKKKKRKRKKEKS